MKYRGLSFSRQLFLSVISIFAVFIACFLLFQYNHERRYKSDILNGRLQRYNKELYAFINDLTALPSGQICDRIEKFSSSDRLRDVRITVIKHDGTVIYDNAGPRIENIGNHLDRKEVRNALKNGSGYAIQRQSSTTGDRYFYSATDFKDKSLVIRSALPYNSVEMNFLKNNASFLWIAIPVTLFLFIVFYRLTVRLGDNIRKLRDFAARADKNESLDDYNENTFPHNELGDISRHIIRIYMKFRQSQEDKIRIKRQLTQNIAHELKTPVSSIQGYLETLVNNEDISPELRKQFIERCYLQTARLTNLLRDISLLNRLDDASLQIENETVDINAIVSAILSSAALDMQKKGIRFHNLLPENVTLHGNPSLVYSIFSNLTENALDYAGPGAVITLKCSRKVSDRYQFTFYDNGTGVPKEHLEKLFERFYRIDKGRSRKLGGTGLGLAIVKNAVLYHGGNIVAKETPGGGLTFEFSLLLDN